MRRPARFPTSLRATTTPVSAPAPTSARVWPTSVPCAPMSDAGEHHDVDGDGCTEPVTVTDGAIVVGDLRYEIGEARRECGRLGLGLRRSSHARGAPTRYRRALRVRLVGRRRRAERRRDCCRPCGARCRCEAANRGAACSPSSTRQARPRARGRRVSSPRRAASRALQLVATSCARGRRAVADAGLAPAAGRLLHSPTSSAGSSTRGHSVATFALLRGVALLAAVYTTVIGAIGLLAVVARSSTLAAITVRLTFPSLRPLIAPVAAFTFTIGGALPAGASRGRGSDRHRVRADAGLARRAARGPGRAGDAAAAGRRRSRARRRSPPRRRTPSAAGDSFWSIAAQHVRSATGLAPSDAEVAPYWRVLIEANRDHLVVPGEPDLIHPGQVFTLPPVS